MPETITQLEQRLGRKLTQFEYQKYLQQWPNVSLGNLFQTNATDAFSQSIENNIQSDAIDRARENFQVPQFSKPIETIRPQVPEEESYVDRVQPLQFPSYLDIGRSGAPTATNLITSVSDKVPKNLSDNFKSFSFTDQIKPIEPPTVKLPSKQDDPSKFTKLGGNLSEGLSTALKVGELAGSAVGGKAGEIISGAANSTGTIISAAKNLQSLSGLGEGTEGLGTAKAGNIGAIIGAASDFLGGFMPQKQEYGGENGDVTKTLDSVYDTASDVAMQFGPIGMAIGGAMKGGALLGKGMNAIGGGTDSMTATDAILGSSFLNLTPFGLINGFGGRKADTITKDMETWTNTGSSYDGSLGLVDFSLTRSGKKYGAFSSGARQRANRMIAEAKRQQDIVGDITEEAQDLRNIQAGTSTINANRRKLQMQGGYQQANIRAAKQGGTLEPTFDEVIIEDISEEIVEFKQGGTIVETIDFLPITCEEVIIEEFQQGGTLEPTFDEEQVMQDFFAGKAPFIQRILDPNRATIPDWENPKEKVATHRLSWDEFGTDEGVKIGIYPKVQLIDGELHDFTDPKYKHNELDASKSAWNNHNIYWVDSKDIADFITKNYKSYIPSFQKYAKGGAINVIPEGALHARKHNLDIDGITEKGIPVVSENKDGEIQQQAEIECAEIILRLEVTQKLEKWMKEYNNEDLTQREKDELAIKAGKLLTKEIIYNTQDNYGLT